MKLLSILTLLPLQALCFAPSAFTSNVSKNRIGSLKSSPFDDSPSPLQEEPAGSSDSSELTYESYEPGVSTEIVTKDQTIGKGEFIAENEDVLTVALIGTVLKTGKEFLNNENYSFELGGDNTFPGFNDGLLGSSVGTRRLIKVPPNKAYGRRGAKGIPPMSDLLFEVEVKAVARSPIDRTIAKIGTDRLAATALFVAFLGISPFLPKTLPSF